MTPELLKSTHWGKSLTIALACLVVACFGLLIGIGIIANNLSHVAGDLGNAADTQQEILDSQEASTASLECRTEQYKEFFAGVASALYDVARDKPINDDAKERLRIAARNLPNIDVVCDAGAP